MCIENRIDKVKPYLVSLRYDRRNPTLDMMFPKDWEIPDKSKKISLKRVENLLIFKMLSSEGNMDDLLEYVEEVISTNIEREEKIKLLKVKVEELKQIFIDNNLEDLKTIGFNFAEIYDGFSDSIETTIHSEDDSKMESPQDDIKEE